jgi:hypothetical protein
MAGAPKGNNNAAKAKVWSAAIDRAVEKRYGKDRVEALATLADKLLDNCEEGDMAALKELGDRLEGKAVQSTEMTFPQGNSAERLNDDELANIATGSSPGAAEQTEGKTPVH